MKKTFVTIIIVVFTIAITNAQTFGVKLGPNLSKYSYNYDSSLDKYQQMFFGFHIGGFAEFEVSEKLIFQPELVYYLQGNKHKIDNNLEFISKQSYLNLPIMAKYYVTEEFNIQAGPQISFLLTSKDNFKGSNLLLPDGSINDTVFNNTNNSVNTKEDYKNIDFGLNFGVEYKMNNRISFDLRYNLGLTDLVKNRANNNDNTMKNSVFSFSVDYTFN